MWKLKTQGAVLLELNSGGTGSWVQSPCSSFMQDIEDFCLVLLASHFFGMHTCSTELKIVAFVVCGCVPVCACVCAGMCAGGRGYIEAGGEEGI